MKKKEKKQPDFYEVEVVCSTCKKKHFIGTTVKTMKIEACSNCHSFYIGSQSFVTVAGQIDKFYKRFGNPKNENNEKKLK
ncbi:50S ribosomal protein L31 [Candidatus Phytoplasma pini]|uniref:50S ribosomal protein L31 n=1 Tax=Candidatus Phytoplasma pini TaxID=267362 RepID=A0A559KJ78_9MOLU|nr:50S ribosomal protein L31 [Candidatus Phytoplasma pini]TVY12148.1 50S ribosomal protein L31 [Candidatus Phytoplasma pini]